MSWVSKHLGSWSKVRDNVVYPVATAAAAYYAWPYIAGSAGSSAAAGAAATGATGASTLSSLAPIAAAGISAYGNMTATNKSIKASQEQIAMQNAYNSPASQMQRLQAAGLNPMLVYSSGNVVGNQSGVASSDYSGYGRGIDQALSTYMAIDNHDMEMQMKAEDLLSRQINNKYMEISNALQVMKTATEDRILQADLLTKQYQNNILNHDWNIIKKSDSTTSKETGVWPRLDRLFRGFDNNFQKTGSYLLDMSGR